MKQKDEQVVRHHNQRSEAFLRALAKTKTDGIIFPCSELASMFCLRGPNTVTQLLRLQRVAFVDGPVNMPFTEVPDVRDDRLAIGRGNDR